MWDLSAIAPYCNQMQIDSTIWRFASPMAVDREHFESQARNDKRALGSFLFQQLRQLGDVGSDPPRAFAGCTPGVASLNTAFLSFSVAIAAAVIV